LVDEALLKDIDESFARVAITLADFDNFSSREFRRYLKSIMISRSDPEAALSALFTTLFDSDHPIPQAGAGTGSIDYVIETRDQGKIGVELKKYLEYDTHRRIARGNSQLHIFKPVQIRNPMR